MCWHSNLYSTFHFFHSKVPIVLPKSSPSFWCCYQVTMNSFESPQVIICCSLSFFKAIEFQAVDANINDESFSSRKLPPKKITPTVVFCPMPRSLFLEFIPSALERQSSRRFPPPQSWVKRPFGRQNRGWDSSIAPTHDVIWLDSCMLEMRKKMLRKLIEKLWWHMIFVSISHPGLS